jgi:hypothetical protein
MALALLLGKAEIHTGFAATEAAICSNADLICSNVSSSVSSVKSRSSEKRYSPNDSA